MAEDMSPATYGPRFADQGATLETGFVVTEIIENLFNNLDGYMRYISVALPRKGGFEMRRRAR
jgi:hypothetical protein